MEYHKIINLLHDTPNQSTKFRTKNWIEINNDSRGTYNTNSQIKFNTSMLRSSLYDYGDAYMLLSVVITITGAEDNDAARRLHERNKGVIFKNCSSFTDCISEINNTQIDNAKYIDVVMPMYNLTEYSKNYLKTSRSLWQYYRDDPNDNITQSKSFKYMVKITRKTPTAGNTKDVEIVVPLKDVSNFWGTLEMPLINCETNLILTWAANLFTSAGTVTNQVPAITDTKLQGGNFINSI